MIKGFFIVLKLWIKVLTTFMYYDIFTSCLITEKTALNGSGTTSMGIFLLGFFRLRARKCLEEIFLPIRLSRSFLFHEKF
jgi:hypothetical protein